MALVAGYSLCAMMPLGSTLAHILACQSENSWKFWWRVDFASILCLWYGGKVFYEGYFAFFCLPNILLVWLVSSALVFVFFGHQFVMKGHIPSVLALYVYMHCPLLFMTFATETSTELKHGVQWSWIGSLCGVVGFSIKQTAVPERWFSRYFQFWFISHQWWHLFTMAGPICCLLAGQHLLVHFQTAEC
jgi:predicted membrane channel-forming protein YqfA (hemolysin III family)